MIHVAWMLFSRLVVEPLIFIGSSLYSIVCKHPVRQYYGTFTICGTCGKREECPTPDME